MQPISLQQRTVQRYYDELEQYHRQGVTHEMAIRTAFQNLLAACAQQMKWTLIPELTLANGNRPDGVLRDKSLFYRGYWEAKDTRDDLNAEIAKKIAKGYPTTNTIFEDTQRAVLYQNGRKVFEADLRVPRKLTDLLQYFFGHQEVEVERFEQAVDVFRQRIPDLARELQALIAQERQGNTNVTFRAAFEGFHQLCREAVDPKISEMAVEVMLVQHLLTERLIRVIFNNPDFTQRNVIAQEIEKVIAALTSHSFNRNEFLRALDPYYAAVEQAAALAANGEDAWTERQRFLNMVYERFFQGYSDKEADTHGIVYTPQEIVDFMVTSVDAVLKREFGMAEGIGQPGVKILDPATGTGNFIVNILRRVPTRYLRQKYTDDLFCNEIMLLPYYVACLNIEHAYYELSGEYLPFEGACFADTLDMAEHVAKSSGGEYIVARPLMMTEANTERVKREREADIMVVMGNPPYNMGQENENDNNKNREYKELDRRIRDTYVKDSQATLRNKLYDAYVRFYRWATDRLQGHDGIVCFVSNNSFVDQIAFDGMRKQLLEDFTAVYHLDLHGSVRKNPKLSGSTHNVFGIQVGVGITIAVRRASSERRGLYYHRVPEDWRRERKLWFLANAGSMEAIEWEKLEPDERHTWLVAGLRPEFQSFVPLGTKDAKSNVSNGAETIFKLHSLGVATNRDRHVYSFDARHVSEQARTFTEIYNRAVDVLRRPGSAVDVDSLVDVSDGRIKWTRQVKASLGRGDYAQFDASRVRKALYRPFTPMHLYFDSFWNEEQYQQPLVFPTPATEAENMVIGVTDLGSEKPFMALVSSGIVDLHLVGAGCGTQCFPYYVYDADGSKRRENITDWALAQFREAYGPAVTKRDIFHYVYGLLHHPDYRERYAENLKREPSRIPLVESDVAFKRCAEIGQQLANLHLTYEKQPEYSLRWAEQREGSLDGRVTFHVKKMKLSSDRTSLIVNETLTMEDIPAECFEYRLGNRSALEWVIDQYQVSEDKRSGIVSDPNRADDPQYIARLVGQVVTVSVETVRLVRELARDVSIGDFETEPSAPELTLPVANVE